MDWPDLDIIKRSLVQDDHKEQIVILDSFDQLTEFPFLCAQSRTNWLGMCILNMKTVW